MSRSCLHHSRTRRVRTLNVRWGYSLIWVMYVGDRKLFKVPDEIPTSRGAPEWSGGKDLYMGWCITERVKRLTSDEIELGVEIPTTESRASNIPREKGNYVCCRKGSTNKDLRGICRNQYVHRGPAIGYWPERCLRHVYIILKPVGSARLTFVDDIVLYELCMLVTECCSESRMRSRTWRGAPKWSGGKDWYTWW